MWAVVAALTFGLFQSVNRASLLELDVFESTFIQLLVSFMVLFLFVLATGELGRLTTIPPAGYGYFALSGVVHFLGGWTLLNQSQKVIGAARTSPLLASTPLFGTILAVLTLGELPGVLPLIGMVSIVGGVTLVHLDRLRRESGGRNSPVEGRVRNRSRLSSLYGIGAAMAWALSPIFIRAGLDVADAPLVGVTIGIFAATVAFGVVLLARGRKVFTHLLGSKAVLLKILAGVLAGFATWTRWYALSLTEVTIVLSLALLSVPTVMILARPIAGRKVERVTMGVLAGSAFVVVGALIIILPRMGGST